MILVEAIVILVLVSVSELVSVWSFGYRNLVVALGMNRPMLSLYSSNFSIIYSDDDDDGDDNDDDDGNDDDGDDDDTLGLHIRLSRGLLSSIKSSLE